MMRKIMLAALVTATPIATDAATISRTFVANAVFTDGGPVTTAGFTFGITYDPNGGNFFNKAVDYYTTTSGYASFNTPSVTFTLFGSNIYINGDPDGTGNGYGIQTFAPDFQLGLLQNSAGSIPPISFVATYTVGDGTGLHNAGNQLLNTLVETTATSGVPEPATWAMMIAGFGLVGGTMRRRRVGVAFAGAQ